MDIELLDSNDFRRSAETLKFIVKAYADCGIGIRIREEEIHCGSSLTYYPYDILSGWVSHPKRNKIGDLDEYIKWHFGGDNLTGYVRRHQDGLEVPTIRRTPPDFDSLLKTEGWKSAAANRDCIPILLGESVTGDAFVCELSHAPGMYHVQMLAGGGLGAGMTQFLENVLTALHTCRSANDLEIYILHQGLGYFAFEKSPMVRCIASIPLSNGFAEALAFMKQIERLITNRLQMISHDSDVKLRDVLVIIDDLDHYTYYDRFAELKKLIEICVSCGRSAKVLFIVGVGDARRKVIDKNFFTTFFALHYLSHEDSRRIIGNDSATMLAKGGEGLFRVGDFCHRVEIPLLSTAAKEEYVVRATATAIDLGKKPQTNSDPKTTPNESRLVDGKLTTKTDATIRDSDDARIEEEMRQHFRECGVSADVKITPVDGYPTRRRCAISSDEDIVRILASFVSFFKGDRMTSWMPSETEDGECCAFEFVLPSANSEDKRTLQSESEDMMADGDGQRFILPDSTAGSDQVYAPLRYEFYDAIESGEKTVEYREYNASWAKKLLSRPMKTIKFSRGYGHAGEKPRQMVFAIEQIGIVDANAEMEIPSRHENGSLVCDADVEDTFAPTHFAIHLGDRLS